MRVSLQPLIAAITVGLLLLFSAQQVQEAGEEKYRQQERAIAEKRLKQVAGALSQSINLRLNLTSSLAAFVTINREFTQQEFDRFASLLQKKMVGVRSLQLAPDGIVKYLTNLESNRAALGHNLFTDERLSLVVDKSVREGSYIVHGPYTLRQGGVAIVARQPLFFAKPGEQKESFWGFATILVETQPILEDAGFFRLEKDLVLAIRGKDGLGARGDVFYGDPSTFESPMAIADVALPDASWQLAVKQKQSSAPDMFLFSRWYWIVFGVLASLFSVITYTILNRPRELREQIYLATENLRTTLHSIGDAVIATDTTGKVTRMNLMAEKLTNWGASEAQGRPLTEVFNIVNTKTREPVNSPVDRVLKSGKTVDLTSRTSLIAKDGTEYQIADSAAPIQDSKGGITGVVLVFRDITRDYAVHAALQESEHKFKAITDQSTEGITVADPDGKYTFVNSAFCRMIGYSEEELLQMTVFDVKAPLQDTSSFARSKTSKEGVPIQVLLQRKDGTIFTSQVIGNMIEFDGQDQVLGTIRDITAQVRAEEERERLLRDTRERVKELRCLYGLAELIRTRDTLQQTFEKAIVLIPTGWQYPEITCARLRFDDSEYVSENFGETEWKQSADIVSGGEWRGTVEIFYLEERPELDKGPFLSEEYDLINGIAHALSEAVEHVQSEEGRIKAESQLLHAQKMDAIGQMAGGIAHDFNNILSIVIGNLGFIRRQVTADEKTLKRVESANKAALRAADLTKQLLGFSRKQAQETLTTNINQVIQGMDSLISRSITPEVEVEHLFTEDLWFTEINPDDFQDALLNLIINARDAMPDGGRLALETCNCVLDASYCAQNTGAKPGEYVQLSVSDNGEGIPSEQQKRIFEPFFTTKSHGKGTGLGLAMVFGFTKRSGGYIKVYSEQGIGTTFRLYLPRAEGQVEMQPVQVSNGQPEILSGGNEVILVVDDEEGLLELAQISLEALGYRVLTASNGQEALKRLAEEPVVDLLFSDVVMPGGINGYELAEKATAIRAELKVLLTSGYTEKAAAHNGQARFNASLLSKPYTQMELAKQVQAKLDG